jgi:peptide/nickel transport system substrate-binding protein
MSGRSLLSVPVEGSVRRRGRWCAPALAGAVTVSLVAGCGPAPEAAGERIGLAYAFVPVAGLSPYSDDAVIGYGIGATETLVSLDAAGRPQPLLAESWTQVDPLTWRFQLRPGVRFHDGSAMTAEVVVQDLQRAVAATPRPRALSGVEFTARAEGEDVVVNTAAPDPVFPQRLSSPELAVLARSAYADPANPDLLGAGTGPYVLEELDGTSGATLDANPDYWGGAPAADGVDVRFLSEGVARANALRAEEVDIAHAVPVSQLQSLGDGNVLLSVPLPRTVSLHLTSTSPVFADPGLRSAARQAVTGLDVAGSIYEGQADRPEGLFGPVSSWATVRPVPSHPDPAAVEGQAITLATYSDRAEMPEIAAAVADALRRAGFQVDLVVRLYTELEEQLLAGEFDAVLMSRSYGQDTADPLSYLAADFGCDGGYNLSLFCDPEVDAQLVAASQLSDVDARQAAALRVENRVLASDVVVPLVHERTRFGVSKEVSGLADDPWERAIITRDTALG